MIDLHVHTINSDGEYTAKKIIDMAIKKNISILAITDHDNISGLKEAIEYANTQKDVITVIPGVELGIKYKPGKMHMLGYFMNYNNKKVEKKLNNVIKGRNLRNKRFIALFNKMGINISIDDVLKYSGGKSIGKPHFARALIEKGYAKDVKEVFNKYFSLRSFRKIKRKVFNIKEGMKLIKDAGGVAVIAHPKTLGLSYSEFDKLICKLKKNGLAGIECYNSIHSEEDCIEYVKIAKKYNLLITAGSDYHGKDVKPDIELGEGINHNIENKVNINVDIVNKKIYNI